MPGVVKQGAEAVEVAVAKRPAHLVRQILDAVQRLDYIALVDCVGALLMQN
ncbi:MAG: hypothetical protein F6K28_55905 [Microcoleus sp. SIO2G3]|nr:hypothetical protein [Microcoleus sp. SIO2G3]